VPAPSRLRSTPKPDSHTFRFRPRLPDCHAPQTVPCKICQTPSPLVGALDFNKSCLESQGVKLPVYGFAVYYRRCPCCQFLFTDYFDEWSHADFKTRIYNDEYIKLDPDYAQARPDGNAEFLGKLFRGQMHQLSVLDYGGGNGRLAERLRATGFAACDTYDPFTPAFAKAPSRKYDVVTCFETFEHTTDPVGCVRTIIDLMVDGGAAVFSTLVQPPDFDAQGLNWWYVGPRNGHISIHSATSLARLWQTHGFTLNSITDNLHIAFRGVPTIGQET
jgi:hypothetical protein